MSHSPGPAFRPNAASPISARRAACGPRTSRSRSTNSWPARRRATNPGGAASPWTTSSAMPGRGAGHRALASLYRAGKVPARDHAEHRQSASGVRVFPATRGRAARQYDLCDLPRLQCALRACLGAAADGCGERLRAGLRAAAATSRPRPYRSVRRCRMPPCNAPKTLRLHCDLFLAIGSSLLVWPAAGFPLMAKRNGARLVDHQSRGDRVRRHCRSRRASGHRHGAGALHRALNRHHFCTGCDAFIPAVAFLSFSP